MGLLLRKRKWENKILLKLVDGDGWLSRVPEISMDKESAVVHAVKAGGTVLQWVMKAWCPYYSWEIMCSVNAGESCRMWSWVNYWGNRKWENKIILKLDGNGLVGYKRSVWIRNLPRCMQWKQVEQFCNEWGKHDVHNILEKSCVQWTLASPVERCHGLTTEEKEKRNLKLFETC